MECQRDTPFCYCFMDKKCKGDYKMEDKALQKLVEEISIKYFKKPFKHKAVFNSRLRTTGGRYHLHTHDLDFNPKVIEAYGTEILEGIIKHELCHYHLHIVGKGYRHGDADFKQLMKKVNGLRFTPSLEAKNEFINRLEYECSGCGIIVYRKRRFNLNKYVCYSCKNKFMLKGPKRIQNKVFDNLTYIK